MSSNKGKAGRRQDDVWEYFDKKPLKSAGHFSEECNFCHQKWTRAYVNELQNHLANGCNDCPEEIQNYWLEIIIAKDLDDEMVPNKIKKVKGQTGIEVYYEMRELYYIKLVI